MMLEQLLSRYASKGVLVDTNILLLYFIGEYDRTLISRFKRTLQFTTDDFDTLLLFLAYFRTRVTTPTILTEVNSFSGQLGEPAKSAFFGELPKHIELLREHYVESKVVAAMEMFPRFGLTDCSILNAARDKYLVLTDDFRLSQYLSSVGIDSINFNHIRTFGWT